ncbi:hypothetical protein ETD83_25475 [Actinomadura soli]|uniref:Uncharacterized protein n=1 Tax=Actinomadura soli TaxID=2508997 RepID=A0A5C4J8L5_9ACTN|nr:hypothetical protein [Actinomadura soli]TMQ93464.1 hypothetical protein ETD83_25475 [Actinomadura soli]
MRLLPLDEAEMLLSEEISASADDFVRLGLDVAREHYCQAIDNVVAGNLEAANSRFRAIFESVIVHFAKTLGFLSATRRPEGGRPPGLGTTPLALDDGGDFVRICGRSCGRTDLTWERPRLAKCASECLL